MTRKQEFEDMLQKWTYAQRFYWTGNVTNRIYLINKQEKTLMEIKNPEVFNFLFANMYIHSASQAFIDNFVNIGGFRKIEYA